MEMLLIILQIFELFLSSNFETDNAIHLIGKADQKTSRRWTLVPKNDSFANAYLFFETFSAGKDLMTTIELKLKTPLITSLNDIESVFGPKEKWLPQKGIGRPKTLKFVKNLGQFYKGVALFRVTSKKSQTDSIVIPSVLLRRIYE